MGRTMSGRGRTERGMRKQALGRIGEDLAADYLERAGMVVVTRNFRCPQGEIDIIARDGETIVFVEVKTRRTAALGSPLEAVTRDKVARLRRLSGIWLSQQPAYYRSTRIDALGIVMEPAPIYDHCPNIQVDS
ncbi:MULTISPECIES: YraN family protein [unclassified Brevibacterium]|uniref:YraN family protein n=1 Tax=unclassified Brevibacterium TaxID=2614124 RepID=UPI001E460F24|nr:MULTISPECIES: YraN family protein [unclassified Brevibacterium]MDK8434974.1 YraN family protein [Brevibacterium sp. H-BE7]